MKVIRFSELRLYLIPKLTKTRTELFKLSNAFFNFTHQFLEIKNPLWILRSQIFFFHALSQIIQLWDWQITCFHIRSPRNHRSGITRLYIFPIFCTQRQCMAGSTLHNPRPVCRINTQQIIQPIKTIGC